MATMYDKNGVRLTLEDAFVGMSELPDQTIDLAIVDPPYGAASDHTWRLPEGHSLPVFGGQWELAAHEWDRLTGSQSMEMTLAWLSELKRLVRPTGSIWIHGTYHNIGFANVACQVLGLEIINEVIWFKRNAFPNLAKRRLTASHESLLWVHTGGPKHRKYRFNYDLVKERCWPGDNLNPAGKQLRTVWDIPNNKSKDELAQGRHPTQKPLRLTSRLLEVAGTPGGTLLVPFAGSGTELVAGRRFGMRGIGFENDQQYFEHACSRLDAELVFDVE